MRADANRHIRLGVARCVLMPWQARVGRWLAAEWHAYTNRRSEELDSRHLLVTRGPARQACPLTLPHSSPACTLFLHFDPHTHLVGYRRVLHATRQVDGKLRRVEDVDGAGPLGQLLARCRRPDDGALAGLGHAVVAGVQHAKAHLVQGERVG